MKNMEWIGNLVSIILFSVLAVASWGLSEFIQRGMGGAPGAALSGPNAIVDNAVIVRTNPQGRPMYRLEASRITHDERDEKSLFEQPRLLTLLADRPVTRIRSDTGVTGDNQNKIDLDGNVVFERDPFESQPLLRVSTTRATLFIEEERAITDAPVFIQRGLSTLQGVGMRLDQKTQKLEIISESRMVVPKENPK
jgi:lipopolysaccharide export system protein LptC